jgi:hypothetical protein
MQLILDYLEFLHDFLLVALFLWELLFIE